MLTYRTVASSALIASLVVLGACSQAPMTSSTAVMDSGSSAAMSARLAGASEVPPTTSIGSGNLVANFDRQSNVLTWTVTYAGLSGPVTAAHFHGPAAVGANAGVALGLTGSLDSPINGMATLTAAQTSDLMAGNWYLNLHTAANPNGEIRGQVSVRR